MVIATHWIEGPKQSDPWFVSVANEADARQAVIKATEYGADFVEVGGAEALSRQAYFALADEAKRQRIPLGGHVPIAVSAEEASAAGQKSIDPLTDIFEVDIGTLAACSRREAEILEVWQTALSAFYASGGDNKPLWSIPGFRSRLELALQTQDEQKAKSFFALLKANHTWFCPTLIAERNSALFDDPVAGNDPHLKYLSPEERNWSNDERDRLAKTMSLEDRVVWRRFYQRYLDIVGAMRRAGVELLAGTTAEEPTSAVPGFSLHDELALLVQAGLTPLEALQAATVDPARFLDRENELGTIATGKVADLVLLDANPLEDIRSTRKIAAVVYGGRFFPKTSLDAMLAKVGAMASKEPIREVLDRTAKEKGLEAAIRQFRHLKTTQPDAYDFGDMYSLYFWARDLLEAKKFKDAIQIFELNTEGEPGSWMVYDGLGEAYAGLGQKELAIRNYKRSLQLDPGNQHAALKLKDLNAQ